MTNVFHLDLCTKPNLVKVHMLVGHALHIWSVGRSVGGCRSPRNILVIVLVSRFALDWVNKINDITVKIVSN
jgi:hypothetical protein